jgi:UDP-xylose/UDP-N-acetylglucosamine transporter B4
MSVGSEASASDFTTGLAILLLAQFLAAYQGAFTEDLYSQHKAEWTENLFYSHLLSLPLFLPFAGTLQHQYSRLAATAPLQLRSVTELWLAHARLEGAPKGFHRATETLITLLEQPPRGILFLATNAITQLSCISGVSLLAAQSSAVTVTIVLNIRKLVSFILSTLLFGHVMNAKMVLGATLVFGSGALYGWETSWRLPRARRRQAGAVSKNTGGDKKHQ